MKVIQCMQIMLYECLCVNKYVGCSHFVVVFIAQAKVQVHASINNNEAVRLNWRRENMAQYSKTEKSVFLSCSSLKMG